MRKRDGRPILEYKKSHMICEVCGWKVNIHCHHIEPGGYVGRLEQKVGHVQIRSDLVKHLLFVTPREVNLLLREARTAQRIRNRAFNKRWKAMSHEQQQKEMAAALNARFLMADI